MTYDPKLIQAMLPCPFCGGEAVAEEIRIVAWMSASYSAGCENCQMYFSGHDSRARAIAAWNTRIEAQSPAQPEISAVTPELLCKALGIPSGDAALIVAVEQASHDGPSVRGRWLAHLGAAAEQINAALRRTAQPVAQVVDANPEEPFYYAHKIEQALDDLPGTSCTLNSAFLAQAAAKIRSLVTAALAQPGMVVVPRDARFYRNALASLLRGICSTTHFPESWEEMEYVQRAKAALEAQP